VRVGEGKGWGGVWEWEVRGERIRGERVWMRERYERRRKEGSWGRGEGGDVGEEEE